MARLWTLAGTLLLALQGGCLGGVDDESSTVADAAGTRYTTATLLDWQQPCDQGQSSTTGPLVQRNFEVPNGTVSMLITASLNATGAGPYWQVADNPGAAVGGFEPGHEYGHGRADFFFTFNGTTQGMDYGLALGPGAIEGPKTWNYTNPKPGKWSDFVFCHGVNV